MKQTVKLPYGQNEVNVTFDSDNLMGIYSPKDVPGVSDVPAEIGRALANPIGSAPLRELAQGKKNTEMRRTISVAIHTLLSLWPAGGGGGGTAAPVRLRAEPAGQRHLKQPGPVSQRLSGTKKPLRRAAR